MALGKRSVVGADHRGVDTMTKLHFNLADLYECVADHVPDREAIVYGDRRLTFGQAEDGSGAKVASDSVEYEQALVSASPERDFPDRSGADLYLIYTGGTTGMPKGVMWRHEDVFFAGLQGGNPGGADITAPEE